jgi:bacillithiol biosynthesis cysteine-adding enzyme BshC
MSKQELSFQETGRFSSLICDYLKEDPLLRPFYEAYPQLENFKKSIANKSESYSQENRKTLVASLRDQYDILEVGQAVEENIALLEKENTFTITTGHQLCLMTGPIYFLYKIISTINLCKQLKDHYPECHFVPIYWMASEDHDFEEISSFRFRDKSFHWNREPAGAVGELPLDDLQEVLTLFEQHLGNSLAAQKVKEWISKSYRKASDLSEATFRLVHELFQSEGLIVIEPNKASLKALFKPFVKEELTAQKSYHSVVDQIQKIQKGYNEKYIPQVNPRTINLFYLIPGGRFRIEKNENHFLLHGTEKRFTKTELLDILERHPERFSPNVILRPVYQEVILPNLCYIGGGGELAYWFQLKKNFDRLEVPFPLLLLRNSALLFTKKQGEKAKKLNLEKADLFLKRDTLINKKVRQISNIDLDLSSLKAQLKKQFKQLDDLVDQTDSSFKGAVEAQKVKQIKGLNRLEKRLLKAQKRVLSDQVQRLVRLHDQLFPEDTLQERTHNFSSFYLETGDSLLSLLLESLDPLNPNFILIENE